MEFTDDELAELKEIFDECDADKSGTIDANELLTCARIHGLNPTPQELEKAKASVDSDNDGVLNFEEFKALVSAMKKTQEEQKAEIEEAMDTMLKSFGVDGKDSLTKEEFAFFLQTKGDEHLTNDEITELFKDIDQDGDTETISRSELVALFTGKKI